MPYCPISISAPRKTKSAVATYARITVRLILTPTRRCGLLVRADSAQAPAPPASPQQEFHTRESRTTKMMKNNGIGPNDVLMKPWKPWLM